LNQFGNLIFVYASFMKNARRKKCSEFLRGFAGLAAAASSGVCQLLLAASYRKYCFLDLRDSIVPSLLEFDVRHVRHFVGRNDRVHDGGAVLREMAEWLKLAEEAGEADGAASLSVRLRAAVGGEAVYASTLRIGRMNAADSVGSQRSIGIAGGTRTSCQGRHIAASACDARDDSDHGKCRAQCNQVVFGRW
jgi:hypothetical protein